MYYIIKWTIKTTRGITQGLEVFRTKKDMLMYGGLMGKHEKMIKDIKALDNASLALYITKQYDAIHEEKINPESKIITLEPQFH